MQTDPEADTRSDSSLSWDLAEDWIAKRDAKMNSKLAQNKLVLREICRNQGYALERLSQVQDALKASGSSCLQAHKD